MTAIQVDKTNFFDILPVFKHNLKTCSFISIDAEYSGLQSSSNEENSLFDTPTTRYEKMKSGTFKIMEFGVALFEFDVSKNEFTPSCYSFLVYPPPFEAASLSEDILCSSSSLVFLRDHAFDFNKWISDGIPYLNNTKATRLSRYLKCHRSILQTGSSSDKQALSFSTVCDKKLNSTSLLTADEIEKIVEDLKGFSCIIKAISESKKLIVGHNCLTDILLMYRQFCDELPNSYTEFKEKLHKLFPKVMDTKRMAFGVKDATQDASLDDSQWIDLLNDTSLFTLHHRTHLEEKFSPKIVAADCYKTVLEQSAKSKTKVEQIPNSPCHTASFDACVTGCLFIQLAYILQRPSLQYSSLHATAGELFFGCNRWLNHINIMRCTTSYINLNGADPKSHRPEIIEVIGHKTSKRDDLLTVETLNKRLAKYGNYDIQEKTGKIYIACGNNGCYKVIRKCLLDGGFCLGTKEHTSFGLINFGIVGAVVAIAGAVAVWFIRSKP